MDELEQLRQEFEQFKRTVMSEVKKLVGMHTHTMGGDVVWRVPSPKFKEQLEKAQAIMSQLDKKPRTTEERVSVADDFEIELVKTS